MAGTKKGSLKQLATADIVARLQSILVNAAEGRRNVGDDVQYPELRRELTRRPANAPALLNTHPSVDSFQAYIRGISDKRERVERVREQFEPLLRSLEAGDAEVDTSAWGAPTRTARLKVVRELLPLAQAAVEGMIKQLSEPGPNGGPLLDGREEAIQHLRDLHQSLGELLAAVEAGHLEDDRGEGLASEVVRYAKRTARALRDDPVPYVFSTLLLGMFHAAGFGGIGGHVSGMALAMRKHSGGKAD